MFKGYIGQVISLSDEDHGDRIKAIIPSDAYNYKPKKDIPYAFPLMPKMLHIKPKIGEAVIILIPNEDSTNEQRFYIGPIISQPQKMEYDSYSSWSATKMLQGGLLPPDNSIDNIPESAKVFPKDDEIALMGRKDSEIILGDTDIRLRCGVRVTKDSKVSLNGRTNSPSSYYDTNLLTDSSVRTAPAFVKLKYYESPLETMPKPGEVNPHVTTLSTATIVADKINLISQNGDGGFNLRGNDEAITDEQMKSIIEKAHCLPYGDKLCEFLSDLIRILNNHVHPSNGAPILSTEPTKIVFDTKYNGATKSQLEDKLLSKDIRIN